MLEEPILYYPLKSALDAGFSETEAKDDLSGRPRFFFAR